MIFEYLIIAGGKLPPVFFVKKLLKISKKVVTVDRGAHLALKLKLKPFLHVGDNDSFSKKNLSKLRSAAAVELPQDKDVSDLEKTLELLSDQKAPTVVIGAHQDFEGRNDHAFINMLLLSHYENLYFADEKNWIKYLKAPKHFSFKVKRGTLFSLVSDRSKKASVFIEGAKYKGRFVLEKPSTGLSNKALDKVKLKSSDRLYLFVSSDITQAKIDA